MVLRQSVRHGMAGGGAGRAGRAGSAGRALVEALEARVLLADLSGSYTWQPIRIGAGGWADGIIISASDPSVRFVRDDTGQAYRWDVARAEWMPLVVKNADGSGLPSSVVPTPSHALSSDPRSFALDPNNNSILYLYLRLSDTNTLGAKPFNVYKSSDGGRNFVATNFNTAAGFTTDNSDDPGTLNVRFEGERLAVDPNNSNVVYIGTGTKGLFRSTDGGMNWVAMTGGGLPSGVDDMNVLPYKNGGTTVVGGTTVSSVIYLVTAAGNVYKSSNGGVAWTNITSGVGPTGKCEQATLDQNTGTLYVPTTDQNLWKYSGTTWTKIKTGGVDSVTVDPNNSNRLFAVAGGGGQVARSLNGGSTWTNLSFSFASTQGFAGTAHASWRSVSKILMDKNGYVWQVEGNDGLIKWLNNDATTNAAWAPDVKGIENFCAMDIAFPNGYGGTKAYVSVQDEHALVVNNLDNFNVTPIRPQTNLSNGATVAVSPNDPNTFAVVSYTMIGAATSWSGITTDGGATFTTFKSLGTLPADLQEGGLAISRRGTWSAGSDHMVWLGNVPYYSKDGGRTWTASATNFGAITHVDQTWRMDRELVADPFVPDKYYVNFRTGGFWVSTDGGVTWTKLSNPGNGAYLASNGGYLSANYKVQNDLWLSLDQLYHSTNGGASWTVVPALGANVGSIALGAGSGQPGDAPYTIYMLYSNARWMAAGNYGVFRSTNAGASWDRIAYWPAGLMLDGNGEFTTNMMAASWDTFGVVGLAAGGQGFVYGKLVTPPAVSAVTVNDGSSQRSMVKSLTVTFNEAVQLSAGALQVKLASGALPPSTTVTMANPSGDQKTYVLTFSGSGVIGGSLADGIYDLVVTATGVQDLAGTAMTANYSQRFHRLFGDSDGNKIINSLDYARLKQTFGRAPTDPLFNSAFDYEANNLINALDLARFRQRYGMSFAY